MDVKQMIGLRIKALRSNKGMTQEQLSEKMEINPKYLSSIERGKENPTIDTLIKLSNALKVDLGQIFAFVQIEDPSKRKMLALDLLNRSTDDQAKLAVKILSSIIE
ncbi:MAG: helix-turn-helix transcriptional regulator [Desulfosalsimonadaceae bacterium]